MVKQVEINSSKDLCHIHQHVANHDLSQETLSQVFTIESLSEIPVLEEFFCNPLDINFEYFTGDFEKIAKRKEFRHGRTMWLWPRTEILKPIMKSKGLNIEGDDYSSNFRGYK